MFGVPLALAGVAARAHATVYFSPEAVRRELFPSADRFVDSAVTLTAAQIEQIAGRTGTRVRGKLVPIWRAMQDETVLGHVVIDEVIGKHEFITYAVALDPDDAVRQIEIMDYRETYGDEIRDPRWRAQFTAKHDGDTLRVGKDIVNISGATLSCVHVTEGVRRVLATFAVAIRGR